MSAPITSSAQTVTDASKPLIKPAAPKKPRKPVNWPRLNVIFHRLLAAAWIVHGLMAWSTILGVDVTQTRPFDTRAVTFQAVTIYFAVVDLLSVVGLWLLAPWGSVVWLIAAVSRLVLAFVFPAAASLTLLGAGGIAACIVMFMALVWMAGRAEARS
jgi:Family of unknown function (DUF6163)